MRRLLPIWMFLGLVAASVVGCGDGASSENADQTATDQSTDTGPDAETDAQPDVVGDVGADQDLADPDVTPLLGPPFPIVLAHGMGGFESLAGVEEIQYFFGVRDVLEAQGEQVLTEDVDPLNTSDARGADLLVSVEAFLAESGHEKCIIIGHSQGGLDARWVANQRPDLVAAVVTYSTPNLGTPVSDIIIGLVMDSRFQQVVDAIVRVFGAPLYDELGNESSLFHPLRLFAEPGIAEFNARITNHPDVAYYSVGGRSDFHYGGPDCAADAPGAPEFIARWAAESDVIDPLLAITEAVLDGGLANPYPNDGLVRARDAHWGRFLGCVPADHMDQVGQLLGDEPGRLNDWDHVEFFVDLVAFLRAEGF